MKNKCNFAALLALPLTVALVLNTTTASAQAPPGSLWYNGDFNGVNGFSNEQNTLITQASVYDNFTGPTGGMWDVTAVFSDNLLNTVVTGATWEIRTGVHEGNGGTLVASGSTQNPTVTATGRSGFGYTEYMVEVTGLNLMLPALPAGQFYWLNVTPVGNGTGRSFISDTSGTNCVGTPCGNDGNAFFNSTSSYFTSIPNDYSMGVIGTVVPEPTTLALLTCGVGALLVAVCRRRVYSNR